MKRTVYLPDELDTKLMSYLQDHPGQTLSSIVQEALETRLARKDVSKLLALAGIVPHATTDAANHAEDNVLSLGEPSSLHL
jgi:hypothetical protein